MEAYHRTALEEVKYPQDLELLQRVVRERVEVETASSIKTPALPSHDTLVVHLRLGDVVDAAVETVNELLLSQRYFYREPLRTGNGGGCGGDCENPWIAPDNLEVKEDWNAYVRPLSYYRNLLADLDSGKFTKVVLMGAAHMGQQHERDAGVSDKEGELPTKSCIYANALGLFFERELGMKATLRLGKPPDEDIVYASHAKTYVQAGGGFSKLLGDLVVEFGGEVLPERKKV